ncbi:uncharacterized protein [Symphalangus syndactylus]|uniref:uncharacterized protein n=1 Tax=Symphalangus syndactylus TaxID=9590 RepID=UPI0030064990
MHTRAHSRSPSDTLEGKVKLKAREQRDRREPLPPPRAMTDAAEAAFSVRTPPSPSSRRAPCPPPLARPSPRRWRVPAPPPPAAPGAPRARGAGSGRVGAAGGGRPRRPTPRPPDPPTPGQVSSEFRKVDGTADITIPCDSCYDLTDFSMPDLDVFRVTREKKTEENLFCICWKNVSSCRISG